MNLGQQRFFKRDEESANYKRQINWTSLKLKSLLIKDNIKRAKRQATDQELQTIVTYIL